MALAIQLGAGRIDAFGVSRGSAEDGVRPSLGGAPWGRASRRSRRCWT